MEERFLITHKSGNRITGPIMITTSPRSSCPSACPLRKGSEAKKPACVMPSTVISVITSGPGLIEPALDKRSVAGFASTAFMNCSLPFATNRPVRSGVITRRAIYRATTKMTISRTRLQRLTEANRGRQGFTYTHFDVLNNAENRIAIAEANQDGFTINLSADTLAEGRSTGGAYIAPVTVVVPAGTKGNTTTPEGRKVVICPARTQDNVTCASCGLCQRQRSAIIAFPALGRAKDRKAA